MTIRLIWLAAISIQLGLVAWLVESADRRGAVVRLIVFVACDVLVWLSLAAQRKSMAYYEEYCKRHGIETK